jgi:hypothetical protein
MTSPGSKTSSRAATSPCSTHCTLHLPQDMASRRLALNLNQALRNRGAWRSPVRARRGFATPVSHGATTESTTLSNGLTVSVSLSFTGHVTKSTPNRLPRSIPHGRRLRRSVFGSMQAVERKQTRRMERHISWNISRSRHVAARRSRDR